MNRRGAPIYPLLSNFDNYIPTATLVKAFDDNNINYIKKMDLEDETRVFSIVFILP